MTAPVVVLDDDATGTQCAADVAVALDPAPDTLATALGDEPLYVLTNTRAVDAPAAARIVRGVRTVVEARGGGAALVLRGDSTLRGHIAVEMAALGLADGVGLIVPAYPAAGRRTLGGVHYLDAAAAPGTQGGRVNVADTEFAADPVFGFRARTMRDWAGEVGLHGRVIGIGLEEVAADGMAVRDALISAPCGAIVVPDVETDDQIVAIARGYRAARAAGRHVVVRCAAPLAAAIAERPGRLLARAPTALSGPTGGGSQRLLVVCGSHTTAATHQLARLAGAHRPLRTLPSSDPLAPDVSRMLAAALRDDLSRTGLALVATERQRRRDHGTLDHGARVMAGLMRVVAELAPEVDAVVAKGGITSAGVATTGLGARTARVRGQITTGVSLWDVDGRDGRTVPQAVVPGNIGDDATLVDVCDFFGAR